MKFNTILLLLLGVLLIISLIKSFIRYDPHIDFVITENRYMVLLWYNRYSCTGDYEGRKMIKLFEI